MNERDFTIGNKRFKLSKIDAFKQFHIVRRLGPILGDIIPVALKIKNAKAESPEEQLEAIGNLAAPLMSGFSQLSDEDADYVLIGLCSAVEMQQEKTGNWARVAASGNLMFDDLGLSELLQIAGRSFAFNMSGFFATAQQVSHGKA